MACSCNLDAEKLILRLKTINEKYGIKLLDDYYAKKQVESDTNDY